MTILYKLENLYYSVRNYFFPHQRWLKKYICWTDWCDKDGLIEDFLSGVIIEFVEKEECFERICWDSDEGHKVFAENLNLAYNWIKYERPEIMKQMDREMDNVPDDDMQFTDNGEYTTITFKYDYETTYGKYDELEKLIHDTDTKWFQWLIENRSYLWT